MSSATMKELLSEMATGLSAPGSGAPWVVMVADSDGMVLSSWEAPGNKINPDMLADSSR